MINLHNKALLFSKVFYITAILILTIFFGNCSVFSAENTVSEKISKTIISYLIEKDPSLASKKIEISFKYADRVFKELKYRKGKVMFSVAELYPDFKPLGNMIVPIQVSVDDVQKEKLFLRTKISVFDNIVVAKKRFKKGDVFTVSDVALESRDIAALSSSAIYNLDNIIGKESKTYIPLGNAIYDWMVKDHSLVKKNEKVKISLRTSNVTIETQGMSLEEGLLGQEVKVKNLDSGKELICLITGTGEVTVK